MIQLCTVDRMGPDTRRFLEERHSATVARRGTLLDARTRPAVIARRDGWVVGVLTYDVVGAECEVLTLHVAEQWAGVGTLLVATTARIAVGLGCSRYWVVTTNDNVDALRFYQRRGFRIAAVRPGAVDDARSALKSTIPRRGNYGIPLRDEIELAQPLPLRDERGG